MSKRTLDDTVSLTEEDTSLDNQRALGGIQKKKISREQLCREALAFSNIPEVQMEYLQKHRPQGPYSASRTQHILRNLKIRRDIHHPIAPRFKLSDFSHPPLDLSMPVVLHGPSGTGKTQFALAHFKRPLLITHIDGLKNLNFTHDGIVFENMEFIGRKWAPVDIKRLLNVEFESPVKVRCTHVDIPAGMKRIFCHHHANIFQPKSDSTDYALHTRYKSIFIENTLFEGESKPIE